ncbi:MAG: cyclic nucleotide-binding domain-containing protein, partial [Chthoniobacterales bacterium]
MERPEVAFLQDKVALLSDFPEEKLRSLTSGSQIITPAAGETITRAGEELHFLGVVLEGKIGAFAGSANGDEQSLGELRPGDTFGEMALMNGEPGIVNFIAVEPSRVMLVPLTLFQSHIMSEPRALQQISRTITERLQTVMSDPRKAAAITRGDDVAGLLELKGERPEHILVLNCGSSSLKYTYFDTEHPEGTTRGCVECIGKSNTRLVQRGPKGEITRDIPQGEFANAFIAMREALSCDVSAISVVGHRVVHGGEKFTNAVMIDDAVL